MNRNRFALSDLSIVMVVAVILSGCAPVRALTKGKTIAPGEVVKRFYDWHMRYPGNVMVDGAYRSSEYLTEEFVEKVDAIVASFDRGGYDPFLCAQDIPGDLIVGEPVVSGDEASVVVHEVWNVGTEYEIVHEVMVELQMVGGAWTIADIVCR
ncbi:MAG: DUF3828 domain-containing protein [Anaerolineae bacterium]